MRFNTDVSKRQLMGDYRYALVGARSDFGPTTWTTAKSTGDSRLGLRVGWDFSQGESWAGWRAWPWARAWPGPWASTTPSAPREALGNEHRIALTLPVGPCAPRAKRRTWSATWAPKPWCHPTPELHPSAHPLCPRAAAAPAAALDVPGVLVLRPAPRRPGLAHARGRREEGHHTASSAPWPASSALAGAAPPQRRRRRGREAHRS